MTSKFIALASAGKEVEWLLDLMFEILVLQMPISMVTILRDCSTALAKAYSQVYNGKSRHIALRKSLVQGYIVISLIVICQV